jgi:anti-anti-sigma regulatory factor
MLKIQKSGNGGVVFTLSGRIEAEDVKELRELLALETAGQHVLMDLRDVTLVNQDAVKFLSSCEADSIKLENCPAYIREWIERVKGRTRRRRPAAGNRIEEK